MFDKGYSLSDVAAVTRGSEDGMFGGNGYWWILLFFLFSGWAEASIAATKMCAMQLPTASM